MICFQVVLKSSNPALWILSLMDHQHDSEQHLASLVGKRVSCSQHSFRHNRKSFCEVICLVMAVTGGHVMVSYRLRLMIPALMVLALIVFTNYLLIFFSCIGLRTHGSWLKQHHPRELLCIIVLVCVEHVGFALTIGSHHFIFFSKWVYHLIFRVFKCTVSIQKRAGKLDAVQIHLLFKCHMCTSGSKWDRHLCNMDNHCHTAKLHCCVEFGISFPNKCRYGFFKHTSVGSNYLVISIIYLLLQILTNGSMT